MGTSLIRGYDIEKFPSNSGGYQGLWKIYSGLILFQKDSNLSIAVKQDQSKKNVSIFLLEKKALFQRQLRQQERDQILDFYRKEILILQKFKHPLLLSILEPLKEDEKCMGFITERITHSMHSIVQNNMLSTIYPSELELKTHITELIDSMKICHCNMCPENIYLVEGKWKLGGLNFAVQFNNLNEISVPFPYDEQFQPNFNFVAPEIVCEKKCGQSSDVFSIGMLLCSLSKAKSQQRAQITNAFQLIGTANASIYQDRMKTFMDNVFSQQFFNTASKNLQIIIQQAIQFQPTNRIGLNEIMQSGWMNDPLLLTIKQLETLEQKQTDVKAQQIFLQGLSKIIFKFESPILMRTVIPLVTNLLLTCLKLSPQLLTILFNLMNKSLEKPDENEKSFNITKQQILNLVWPKLKQFLQNKEMPAQSLYLILNNLVLFQQYISSQDFDVCVLPLILKSMDCQVPKLQLIALAQFKFLQQLLPWQVLKSKVIQRLINLCTNEKSDVEVQKKALTQIAENIEQFDKLSLESQILSMLEKINQSPTISLEMSSKILQIYDYISQQTGADLISNRILPQLIPLLGDQRLSKQQFKNYMEIVRKLLDKIEKERQDNFNNIPGQSDFDVKQIEEKLQQNQEISLPQIQNEIQQQQQHEVPKQINPEQTFSNEFDFLKLFQPELDIQTNQEPKALLLNPEKEKSINLYEKSRVQQQVQPQQEQQTPQYYSFANQQQEQQQKNQINYQTSYQQQNIPQVQQSVNSWDQQQVNIKYDDAFSEININQKQFEPQNEKANQKNYFFDFIRQDNNQKQPSNNQFEQFQPQQYKLEQTQPYQQQQQQTHNPFSEASEATSQFSWLNNDNKNQITNQTPISNQQNKQAFQQPFQQNQQQYNFSQQQQQQQQNINSQQDNFFNFSANELNSFQNSNQNQKKKNVFELLDDYEQQSNDLI